MTDPADTSERRVRARFAQRCYLANVYASWLLLAALTGFLAWRSGPLAAVIGAAVGAAALYGYVRAFPVLSRFIGYGSVDDAAGPTAPRAATTVRLYTALGCPFCPIVRHRLIALRERMGFELEEIDVTLRPNVLLAKGIRAVPVVEVGERRHIGHATTDELAAFVTADTVSKLGTDRRLAGTMA